MCFFSIDNPYHSTILGGRSPLTLFNSLIGVNLCCSQHGCEGATGKVYIPSLFRTLNWWTLPPLSHTQASRKKWEIMSPKLLCHPLDARCVATEIVVEVVTSLSTEILTLSRLQLRRFFQLRVGCWRIFFHKSLFFSREGKWERERWLDPLLWNKMIETNEEMFVVVVVVAVVFVVRGFFSLLKLVAGTDLAILYHDL